MIFQFLYLPKVFATQMTLVGVFTRMDSLMLYQIIFLRKRFVTHITSRSDHDISFALSKYDCKQCAVPF